MLRTGKEDGSYHLGFRAVGSSFRLQGLGFRALSFVFGVDDLIAGGQ